MARVFQRRRPEKRGGGFYPDYYAEYRNERGRKVWEKIGPSRRRAEVRLAERIAEVEERRRDPSPATGDGSQLFREFLAEYDQTVVALLRERVQRRLRLRYWTEFFAPSARLRDIRKADIEAYKAKRLARGKAPATVNRELATIKGLLQRAVEWGRIPYNVAAGVKLEIEDNQRDRVLSDQEVAALVCAARESKNTALAAFIVLAVNTGGRRAELLGLRWGDLDTRRGLVILRHTKAKRTRSIPVEPWVVREIQALPSSSDRIFTFRGKALTEIKRSFPAARERAGLGPDVVLHSLRHTFATRLAENGVAPSVIQKLMGHSSLKMVERYTHVSDAAVRDAVAGLNLGRPNVKAVGSKVRKPSRGE